MQARGQWLRCSRPHEPPLVTTFSCCGTMAASGSRPSAPSLAALPDDLLVACFEQLEDPLERCGGPIASRQPPRGRRCAETKGAAAHPCATACRISSHPAAGAACCRRCAPAGGAW